MGTTATWKLQLAAGVTSLALISVLVVQVSSAAFTAKTSNASNSWATGQVALTDDAGDPAVAMFSVTGMLPGQTVTRCIEVTYTGSADPGPVKLYATGADNGLGQYLDVTVTEGSGSTFAAANCAGFVADPDPNAEIVSATLADFKTSHGTFVNGAGIWDPTTTGDKRVYQFVVQLNAATPDSAQNANAAATFTWETATA